MESCRSELPDDIIHRITNDELLCKPTFTNKEAIKLSLVSKEFYNAVQRRPVLVFEWNNDNPRCSKRKELKYLVSTLTERKKENMHLDTFVLSCSSFWVNLFQRHSINRCIELAAADNLGLRNLKIDMLSALPQCVLQAESLVQLELENCKLKQDKSSMIRWPNLKRLRLVFVGLEGEEVFEDIIRGCPLIETLEISSCCSKIPDFNFKVSNLGYLKKLHILLCGDQTLELGINAAPNLESLKCYQADLMFQVDLGTYEFHKLKRLHLSLKSGEFSVDFLETLAHRFPVLEELSVLNIGRHCERINISSPSLREINLENIQGLQEARLDVPNIDS